MLQHNPKKQGPAHRLQASRYWCLKSPCSHHLGHTYRRRERSEDRTGREREEERRRRGRLSGCPQREGGREKAERAPLRLPSAWPQVGIAKPSIPKPLSVASAWHSGRQTSRQTANDVRRDGLQACASLQSIMCVPTMRACVSCAANALNVQSACWQRFRGGGRERRPVHDASGLQLLYNLQQTVQYLEHDSHLRET